MMPATLAPINLSEFAARVALHGDKAGSIFALIADASSRSEPWPPKRQQRPPSMH